MEKKNFFMKHKIITGLAILFILGSIGSAAGGGSKTTAVAPTNTTNTTATNQAAVLAAAKAKAETDKMNSDIVYFSQVKAKEVVTDRFVSAENSSGSILITFKLSDNLSMKMVGDVAFMDASKIFANYKGHAGAYNDVTCLGTYPMKDKYGNVTNDVIFAITLDKDTIQKTTFENLNPPTDLLPLASSHAIRPELLTN
jgi:hypothetical protein